MTVINTMIGANWVTSVLRTAKLDAKGKSTKANANDGTATPATLPATTSTPVTSASTGTDATSTSAVSGPSTSTEGTVLRPANTRKGVLHGKHSGILPGGVAPMDRPTPSKQVNPYLGDGGEDSSDQPSPRKRIFPGMGPGDPKLPLPPHKHLPVDSERRNYKAPQIHEEHSFAGKKRSSRYTDQEGNKVDGKQMNLAMKEEALGMSDPSSSSPRSKRISSSRSSSKSRGDTTENGSNDGDKATTDATSIDNSTKNKKKVATARPDYVKLGGVDGLPVQYVRVTPKKKEGAASGTTPTSEGRRRLEEETTTTATTATTATTTTTAGGESSTASTTTTAVAAATPANIESSSSTPPSTTSNDVANANSGMIADPVPIPPADATTTSSSANGANAKRRQPGGIVIDTFKHMLFQHTLST